MTRGVPVLDPKRDLAGATPEKLARALFRRTEPLQPARVRKPVVGAAKQERPTDGQTVGRDGVRRDVAGRN